NSPWITGSAGADGLDDRGAAQRVGVGRQIAPNCHGSAQRGDISLDQYWLEPIVRLGRSPFTAKRRDWREVRRMATRRARPVTRVATSAKPWREVRGSRPLDEGRVAEHRARMDAEVRAYRLREVRESQGLT